MQARARDVRPLQQPKLRLAAQLLVLFLVPAIWLLVSTDYITSIASAPRQSSRDLDFVAKPGEALAAIAGVKRIRSFRLHQHPEIPYLLVASPYEPALLFSFDASGHLERVLDIPVKACRDVVGFTLGDSSWILPISGAAATSPLYRVIALSSRDGEGVEGDTAASIRVQHVADVETQGASSVSAFVRGGRQPEAVVVMTHPRSGQLSAHRMTAADPGGLTRPFQRIDLPGVASLGCCEAAAAALSKGSLQADGGSGGDSLQYLVAAPHQAVDGYEHAAHLLQYDGVQLTSIQQFSVQSSRRISCWVDRGRLHVSAASSRGQEDAPVPSPLLRSSRNGTLAVQQQIFVSHARDVAHFSIGGLHLLAFASYGFSGACRKDGSVLVYEFMPSTGRYVLMTIIRTPCATSVEFVHAAARHFLVIGSDLGRDDSLAEQLPASTVWEMHVKKRAAPQVAAFLERDGAVRGQDLVV